MLLVVGKTALYVPTDAALDYVAGYALHNDYSERSFQLERGGQWVKGKSADTFAPLGPFLASPDELPDPGNLKMWLKVNGEIRQNSSTANMILEVATLLSYVSQFMTVLPGDVVGTGTPAGVGPEYKPFMSDFIETKNMQVCRTAVAACVGLVLLMVSAPAHAQYRLTNLVSNQIDENAPNTDPLLVNPWGLARSATSPWWVSDNLSGWSTLYNATGTPQRHSRF